MNIKCKFDEAGTIKPRSMLFNTSLLSDNLGNDGVICMDTLKEVLYEYLKVEGE